MSNGTPVLTKTYTADAAIAANRIVAVGAADGSVAQGSAASDPLLGVSVLGATAAGDRVDVDVAGISAVEYGGNVTRGDQLTSDANGKAVAVTRHTHTENTAASYTQNATTGAAANVQVIGRALMSGVSGDIADVLLGPAYA